MTTFVPKEVQAGLDKARKKALKTASRLRLSVDGNTYPVLRMWKTGFAVDVDIAPTLRGFADLYDGSIHLSQCLIVASEKDGDEVKFEFKRLTAVSTAPAIDSERRTDSPAALIAVH
ncbi:MAG: hypothetical protein ABJP79_14050 [Tateyamaria sp.]|uniref:hypothetical protein n=1 Tax=Tateyamaria sp. TaxID=1929288 RepID=UPI00329C3E64